MSLITKIDKDNTVIKFGENYDGFTAAQMRKWLHVAKDYQEKPDGCLSRQIGCIIVDPLTNSQVSAGHNGPPDNTALCDSEDYLRKVVWPQLNQEEKKFAGTHGRKGSTKSGGDEDLELFIMNYAGCGECPRRMVGCPSGQRLELCTCAHGETNAIIRAHRSVRGMWMFCWCGVPCIDCTKLIINSRLEAVVALDNRPEDKTGQQDYSPYSSRWLFEQSKTKLYMVSKEWIGF